jgi:hypothetical protein
MPIRPRRWRGDVGDATTSGLQFLHHVDLGFLGHNDLSSEFTNLWVGTGGKGNFRHVDCTLRVRDHCGVEELVELEPAGGLQLRQFLLGEHALHHHTCMVAQIGLESIEDRGHLLHLRALGCQNLSSQLKDLRAIGIRHRVLGDHDRLLVVRDYLLRREDICDLSGRLRVSGRLCTIY